MSSVVLLNQPKQAAVGVETRETFRKACVNLGICTYSIVRGWRSTVNTLGP